MASSVTVDFGQSMFGRLLNSRNAFDNIYYLANGYGRATQFFIALAGGYSKSQRKNIADGKYEFHTISHTGVQAQVATRTLAGGNLILTWTDPTYDAFRNGFVTIDGSTSIRRQGQVVSHSAGTVTLAPVGTPFGAADYIIGSFATEGWNMSANRGSTGTESKYVVPETDFNYASIKRESQFLSRRDFHESYLDGAISKPNWAMMQEPEMTRNFARSTEYARLFEERKQILLPSGQLASQNGGLLWSIQNRGGSHVVSPSDLNKDTWLQLIHLVAGKTSSFGGTLVCFHGKEALGTIQRFTQDFVQGSGSLNTFGAKYGIDITSWAYIGQEINFVHLPILDDEKVFGKISNITGKLRSSHSFFLCDMAPTTTYDVVDGTAPVVQPFHFSDQEINYGYVHGTIGSDGVPNSPTVQGKHIMSSDIDGVSSHIWSDGGINIANAAGMIFWELTD